jgi:hypothetical protein
MANFKISIKVKKNSIIFLVFANRRGTHSGGGGGKGGEDRHKKKKKKKKPGSTRVFSVASEEKLGKRNPLGLSTGIYTP